MAYSWKAHSPLLFFVAAVLATGACTGHGEPRLEEARLAQEGPNDPGPTPGPTPDPSCPTSGPAFPADLTSSTEPSDAGAIAGSFSVTATGDARYVLPLEAAPGRAGMSPRIALEYDGSGDGAVGFGISLSGFSRVTRCPKNQADDDAIAPIAYDDKDPLCIDGRRLVKVGEGAGIIEYRTIPESFTKILAFFPTGWDPALGPSSLRAYTKEGLTVDYGTADDSKAIASNGAVRAWWVARSTDRSGNWIKFAYHNHKNVEDPAHPYTTEILPDRISYTGHPNLPPARSVVFVYNERPASLVRTTFTGGMKLRTSRLLSKIEMRAPLDTIVRQYELAYTPSSTTGRSLLTSLKECTAQGLCKPATRFGWNTPPTGFDDVPTELPDPLYESTSVITTDLEGDGLDDVVMAEAEPDTGVPVTYFYTASPFAAKFKRAFFSDIDVYPTPIVERGTPIDIDHDGRLDLFLHDMNGNATTWKVLRAQADGTFDLHNTGVSRPFPGSQPIPTGLRGPEASAHLADMNGDGMADLVTCTKAPVLYAWTYRPWAPTPGGFAAATEVISTLEIQPCNSDLYTVDVDGDGKSELVVPRVEIQPDGSPQFINEYDAVTRRGPGNFAATAQDLPTVPPGGGMFFLDVNGDGLPDAIQTGFSEAQPRTFLNTGAGYLQSVSALPGVLLPSDTFARLGTPIDFDGDGLQDLLIPLNHSAGGVPHWSVLRSRGDGTFEIIDVASSIPFDALLTPDGVTIAHPSGARVMEANGDGANDVLLPIEENFHVFLNRAAHVDTLASVTDGMARHQPGDPDFEPGVAIKYATLADPSVYERAEGCEYPVRCVAGPRRVVAAYEVDTAGKEPRRYELHYKDARFHRLGRGFLGFAERVVRDVAKDAGRIEVYDNKTYDPSFRTFPFAGQPTQVMRWATTRRTNDVTVELSFSSIMHQLMPSSGGTSYFTMPVYRRERVEQGELHLLVLAADFQGSFEVYTKAASGGTADTTRLSESIHMLLDTDDFGNALAEKTLVAREFNLFSGTLESQAETLEEVTRTFENDTATWQIGLLETQEHCSTAGGRTLCRAAARTYDGSGRLSGMTVSSPGDPDSRVDVSFGRDVFGNITKTVARDAFEGRRATCTAYEPEGIFPYVSGNAKGHLSFAKFHPGFGAPLTVIDPNGRATQWALDGFGRVAKEKKPGGVETTTTILRNAANVIRVRTTTPGWGAEEVELDRLGRPIRQWTRGYTLAGVLGPRTLHEITYDSLGEHVERVLVPTAETTPEANRHYHRFERDGLGRVTKHFSPWGGVTRTQHEGSQVWSFDARGGHTVTQVDGLGRIVKVLDAKDQETTYGYGPFGGLWTVTEPGESNNRTTTMERDAFGRVRTLNEPDRGTTVTRYSGFGESWWTQDALGRETLSQRDGLGRVTRRVDVDGETLWTWDTAQNGIGAIDEVQSPKGHTKRWSYDGAGRPIATELGIGVETFTIGFDYDAQSRLSKVTYPEAAGVSFEIQNVWDDAGHLVKVREVGSVVDTWAITSVDGAGRITGEVFGNGAETTRVYDESRDRIASIRTTTATTLQQLSFGYDEVQNVTRREDSRNLVPQIETFQYDELQRLSCAAFDGEAPCARSWTYHANGNLLSSPGAGAYDYDPARPHVLLTTQLGAYVHDAVGNQIGRPDATVEYTAFDLPKRLILANGAGDVLFDYDGDQQRIRKTAGDLVSVYVNELYERVTNLATGAVEHRYHVKSGERTVAVVTRSGAATTRRYLHVDHLGSVDVVSNEMGTEVDRRSYDPFGARRNPQWGTPPAGPFSSETSLGFTGHLGDEELGLVFMRGRMYDPKIGRFLTPDPLVANAYSGQSWNPFSYVENNPLTFTDPSGFRPEGAGRPDKPPTVWIIGQPRATPVTPFLLPSIESVALRTPSDFGTIGTTTAFRAEPAPGGGEQDRKDGWDVALDALGGFASEWAEDMTDTAITGAAILAAPSFYFAYKGFQLWTGVISTGVDGYEEGGLAGAAKALFGMLNPLRSVGELKDAVDRGDYGAAGAHGYHAIKMVVQTVAGGVLVGGARGLARGAADSAQALRPRPTTVAALETRQGTFTGVSGSARPLHRRVQDALDAIPQSQRSPFHGRCAEPQCISGALEAGVNPAGGIMTAARVRAPGNANHGTAIPACPSCAKLQEAFGIKSGE
ncbi:RHS repeat-associated core domain-containing protein [Polyangium sp. 15x6]|uniref:RHS repeat-associated core domain-containing protein n=1 Tax=Polyangium sp. 15x6 TaxID=3042687 RepID=UPI00249CF258|nr:RHS repeat-associated core domain-containing protein [Polyangium sp. 15x6]MDI3282659.1 FG-GAP-like repeat-containing protein [Polyangium sp. 15x6]